MKFKNNYYKKKRKAYISGPMTGYKLKNLPIFMKAESYLKAKNYIVKNPATKPNEIITRDSSAYEWLNYMKQDIDMIEVCDDFWCLVKKHPSITKRIKQLLILFGGSYGTLIEYLFARKLKLNIHHFNGGFNVRRRKIRSRKTKI